MQSQHRRGWVERQTHTTPAALAVTSRSAGSELKVSWRDEIRVGESRDRSRLHSVASALNMFKVMRSELADAASVQVRMKHHNSLYSRSGANVAVGSFPAMDLDPSLQFAPELVQF